MASTKSPPPYGSQLSQRSSEERRGSQRHGTVTNHGLASDEDAAVLAKLGYKQELRRNFSMIEVFGIAFSIMGLLPSIASTLAYSIPAGPVGMVRACPVEDPDFLSTANVPIGMGLVPSQWMYFPCWPRDGRPWQCHADQWWSILVDTLFRVTEDEKPSVFSGRVQQYPRSSRRPLFH